MKARRNGRGRRPGRQESAARLTGAPGSTAGTTRERLLAAAAREFAERGFDGAKVDRIAARARINKAMLYYHFEDKAALYRAILDDVFRGVADAVDAVRRDGGPPDAQLRAYIRTVAGHAAGRPHFAPLWLREIAEGGRHLDARTVALIGAVVGSLAALLREGREAGLFADVNPFVIQIGIVAPLLMMAASRPVRARFRGRMPTPVAVVSFEDAIAHVETMTLAALRPSPAPRVRSRQPGSRRPSR
jgi:AcrR family transcriptional regulator